VRAQWCGPCRKFSPLLTVCYEDLADKNEVEVRAAVGKQDRAVG
jgi:thiol-disulfide isomerase/thioredoxin